MLEDPDDPEAHRALGEALLATGEQLRGQEELELALAGYEGREDWQRAADLVNELIRLDPNGVRYHQKRVEIGFRSGDRAASSRPTWSWPTPCSGSGPSTRRSPSIAGSPSTIRAISGPWPRWMRWRLLRRTSRPFRPHRPH